MTGCDRRAGLDLTSIGQRDDDLATAQRRLDHVVVGQRGLRCRRRRNCGAPHLLQGFDRGRGGDHARQDLAATARQGLPPEPWEGSPGSGRRPGGAVARRRRLRPGRRARPKRCRRQTQSSDSATTEIDASAAVGHVTPRTGAAGQEHRPRRIGTRAEPGSRDAGPGHPAFRRLEQGPAVMTDGWSQHNHRRDIGEPATDWVDTPEGCGTTACGSRPSAMIAICSGTSVTTVNTVSPDCHTATIGSPSWT